MMTDAEKANAMFDAADKLATAYRSLGDHAKETLVIDAFAELPRDSAAKLYDIIRKL